MAKDFDFKLDIDERALERIAKEAIRDKLDNGGLELTCPNCGTAFVTKPHNPVCPGCGVTFAAD